MYSMVLMVALSGTQAVPDRHRCHGCHGCRGCYSCSCGCWGGGYGCCGGGYGGCHGCYGGGCYGGGCYGGGCYGGGCYGGGCYGGGCGGCGGYYVMPGSTGGEKKKEGTGGKDGKKQGEEEELGTYGPAPATLIVTLPADAKLTVDGNPTTSTSSLRRFTTPPLPVGRDFSYTLEAKMEVDGKPQEVSKRVIVRAGQETRTTLSLSETTAQAR
jgi:uncharacterized protein (TIGR03000 family)